MCHLKTETWFKSHWTNSYLCSFLCLCMQPLDLKENWSKVERDSSFLNSSKQRYFSLCMFFESFSEHYFSLTDRGNTGWLNKCNILEFFSMGKAFWILISRSFNAVLLKNAAYRCHPLPKKKVSLEDSLNKWFSSCCKTDSTAVEVAMTSPGLKSDRILMLTSVKWWKCSDWSL